MKWKINEQIQFSGVVLRSHVTEGSIQTRFAETSLSGKTFTKLKKDIIDVYAKYVKWDVNKYDNLIAVFNPDGTTDILINEIQFTDYNNHIKVDGTRNNKLKFIGIELPEESGIIIYLTWKDHQLAMYDVTPVVKMDKSRPVDFEIVLGSLVDEIDCQTEYVINADEWKEIIDAGWFPFAFLQGNLWCKIREKIHCNEDLTESIEKISDIIASTWGERIDLWRLHPILKKEIRFLESAHECFVTDNWIAVNSILGPRIEGVITEAIGRFLKHKKMISEFKETIVQKDYNNKILNIDKLAEYLEKVVYADVNMMNPISGNTGINRHLLGHGRVSAERLNQFSAVVRFLTIDHISRYWPEEEN